MKKTKRHSTFLRTLVFLCASTSFMFAQPMPPEGAQFGSVPNEQEPELEATYTVDGSKTSSTQKLSGQELSSNNADENVLLIKNAAKAQVLKSVLTKVGDSSNDGQSNFYGLNAAVVAKGGSHLTLKDVSITSSADGANAVFSTGEGSVITIKNIKITTTENSSRGLDSTYGGVITADSVDINTKGAHCAAFATERGEGTVTVRNGSATTQGEGSPVIYSTGNISVKNLTGKATNSEIAVIEGKNSITIDKSTLEGNGERAVMLYQSMSGDANQGTSVFTVKNSSLKSLSNTPFFYITNTQAVINISNTSLEYPSGVLIQSSGNNSERGWGQRGANGGTLTFNAQKQNLVGDILCDSISSIALNLDKGTSLTGKINANAEGKVNLKLSKNAKLVLTGNSYINELVDEDKTFSNIISNGYTLYYNTNASANNYLAARIITLKDGGRLEGVAMETKEVSVKDSLPTPQKMQPSTIKGTVSILTENGKTLAILKDTEGSEYLLSLDRPGLPNDAHGAQGKKPDMPPPPSNKEMGMQKEPPAPPSNISAEELQSLNGKTVEVRGFIAPAAPNEQYTQFVVQSYKLL